MQMDDISLLELWQTGNIGPGIGNIYLKQVLP